MLRLSLRIFRFFTNFFCNFSWEGGGTLPKNSSKPSRDLLEDTLLRRTRSVQRLARSFGTDTQTDKHTSCYFIIRRGIGVLCSLGTLKESTHKPLKSLN